MDACECKSIKYVNYASAQESAKVCCNLKSGGKVGKIYEWKRNVINYLQIIQLIWSVRRNARRALIRQIPQATLLPKLLPNWIDSFWFGIWADIYYSIVFCQLARTHKEGENLEVATRRLRKSLAPAGQMGLGLNSLALPASLCLHAMPLWRPLSGSNNKLSSGAATRKLCVMNVCVGNCVNCAK